MIENRLILFVKVNGRDLADNAVLGMNGAPGGSEIAQWEARVVTSRIYHWAVRCKLYSPDSRGWTVNVSASLG